MRLVEYVRNHHEAILVEWEAFASTLLPAARGMTTVGLRDHAEEILGAIVSDMEALESASEKTAKSKGRASKGREAGERLGAIGQLHAVLRIESGFTLSQVVAEYRALRATVFRLWASSQDPDPDGVLRFNEAIDAALAEAVERYRETAEQYRDQVVGVVSHDLRNPLGGILAGSSLLMRAEGLDDKSARVVARIEASARRMVCIVDDLLDLSRARLGGTIPILRGPTDLGPICELVIAELEGSYPTAVIRYAASGDLRGEWDRDRVAQVLSNLVGNALQHGSAEEPIHVVVRDDDDDDVVISVRNGGPPIPESALRKIFEPMVRGALTARTTTGLGLGLFIAKEIVTAHDGSIDVSSSAVDGTTFTVRLPRAPRDGRSPRPRRAR